MRCFSRVLIGVSVFYHKLTIFFAAALVALFELDAAVVSRETFDWGHVPAQRRKRPSDRLVFLTFTFSNLVSSATAKSYREPVKPS
jgi:hypothetical protein